MSIAKINILADFVVVFRNDPRKTSAVDFRLLSHKTTETETKLCESFTHSLCKSTSSVTYVAQDNSTVSIVIKLILRNLQVVTASPNSVARTAVHFSSSVFQRFKFRFPHDKCKKSFS